MEEQRERARAARQDVDSMQVQNEVLANLTVASEFVGYDTLSVNTEIACNDRQWSSESRFGRSGSIGYFSEDTILR